MRFSSLALYTPSGRINIVSGMIPIVTAAGQSVIKFTLDPRLMGDFIELVRWGVLA
jgi:hypothetical protein